jgi:hypothetical protein
MLEPIVVASVAPELTTVALVLLALQAALASIVVTLGFRSKRPAPAAAGSWSAA